MELVTLPDNGLPRELPFYLAMEEWLAHKYPGRDFFFMWQVEPTVIIGRHQLLEHEVDTKFCTDNGIDIVRRKSGGGAVLADMNNIMLSYITSSDNVTTTFSEYTSMVARSLRLLGLDANDNSRNDILIGDRKVSGNSYYHLKDRSIVHGTMLYDFDTAMMARALTPPSVKLKSHGVKSVRSRITTIKEHLPGLTISEFKHHMSETIAEEGILVLNLRDISEIEEMAVEYRKPEWLTGRNPRGSITETSRIEGVGTLSVHLTVSGGKVSGLALTGDYLATTDNASDIIASLLSGSAYSRVAMSDALSATDLSTLIPGLKNEEFINLIC